MREGSTRFDHREWSLPALSVKRVLHHAESRWITFLLFNRGIIHKANDLPKHRAEIYQFFLVLACVIVGNAR
jgi:hypothetical protein